MRDYEILPSGENSLCISFQSDTGDIQVLAKQLRNALPQLQDVIPAYDTITLAFDGLAYPVSEITDALVSCLELDFSDDSARKAKEYVIPVCYDPEVAADIEAVCQQLDMSSTELIKQHTQTTYPVAMLGFQPGFVYLDGLLDALSVARKATPEQSLAAGSVAIGGTQTGIYSLQSPGGWWVIGRTPTRLFNPEADPPIQLAAGDIVRFKAIDIQEYRVLSDAD